MKLLKRTTPCTTGWITHERRRITNDPGYRLRKCLKRKRVPLLAAAGVLAMLIAGVIGTTIGLTVFLQVFAEPLIKIGVR